MGSEPAGLEQASGDVVGEVAEAEGGAAQAQIAAACEVSLQTVFNYFPTKESMLFDRFGSRIPAERLEDFNDNIVGTLDVVHTFR